MAHLTSCYFCSTALDRPLQSYKLPGAGETAVSLCRPCEEKLGTIFETVGIDSLQPTSSEPVDEPVEQETSTDDASATIEETSVDDAPTTEKATSGDEKVTADETEGQGETVIEDGDIIVAAEEVDVDDGVDVADEDDSDSPFSGRELLPDDDPLASDSISDIDVEEVEPDGPDIEEPESDTADTDEAEPDISDGEDANPGSDTDTTEDSDTESGTDEADASETGTESEQGSDGGAPERTITARDYNKVVRLLRNREFPVDREEFESIASSAYDLYPEECAQVLNLAIDKDLLEERDGMLYKP